ncbi:uncharacterized protein LOC123558261 [Mercenaria mercenaria]|uniref:uncharacterized protein LOC123558261 n=1 Tax=Mercenaria mercenaria TaxID=6596 RepID=UPI00234F5082|nr:uncharacterized protein LOC123558261 [Mercenaria mercenaria]
MASHGSDSCSEEKLEIKHNKEQNLCNDCLFDDLKVDAFGFCTICSQYLCEECCRSHKKSSATRDHNIEECTTEGHEQNFQKEVRVLDETTCKPTVTENSEIKLVCDPCLFDNTEMPAVGFCVICVEYLCQECCRDHKKSKTTRSHNILKENIPTNSQVFKTLKEMTSCSEHTDTQVSHICKDHKIHVCVMCIAGSHRRCKSVSELTNTDTSNLSKLDEVGKKLLDIRNKSNSVKEKRKENMEALILDNSQIQCNISACADEVNNVLQQLKESALKSSNSLMDSEISRLTKDVAICNDVEKDIEMYTQILDATKQHISGVETGIIADSLGKKLLAMDTFLNKKQHIPDVQMKFTQNPILGQIRTLGNVTMHQKAPLELKSNTESAVPSGYVSDEVIGDDDISSSSGSDVEDDKNDTEKKVKKQKQKGRIKDQGKYKIKASLDQSPCSIIGGFILPGGNIVLVDETNRNIKLYTRNYKIMFYKPLEAQPTDVCRIGPKNFALVYKDLKQIDKFMIEDRKPNAAQFKRGIKSVKTIQLERSFKTRYENYRITMYDKEIALLCKTVGSSIGSVRLELRQESNNQLDLESSLPYSNKEEQFDFNQCGMCSTPDGIVLYSKSTGLVCFVRRRNMEVLMVKWKIDLHGKIPNLERVIGDTYGNLFVCSTITGSVYQIAADDHSQITTVASRLINPVSLVVNDKIGKLLVGCENDDNLYIFDLQKKGN